MLHIRACVSAPPMRAIKVVTKNVAMALRPDFANGIFVSLAWCVSALIFLSQMFKHVFDQDQSETVPLCRNFYLGKGLL